MNELMFYNKQQIRFAGWDNYMNRPLQRRVVEDILAKMGLALTEANWVRRSIKKGFSAVFVKGDPRPGAEILYLSGKEMLRIEFRIASVIKVKYV